MLSFFFFFPFSPAINNKSFEQTTERICVLIFGNRWSAGNDLEWTLSLLFPMALGCFFTICKTVFSPNLHSFLSRKFPRGGGHIWFLLFFFFKSVQTIVDTQCYFDSWGEQSTLTALYSMLATSRVIVCHAKCCCGTNDLIPYAVQFILLTYSSVCLVSDVVTTGSLW